MAAVLSALPKPAESMLDLAKRLEDVLEQAGQESIDGQFPEGARERAANLVEALEHALQRAIQAQPCRSRAGNFETPAVAARCRMNPKMRLSTRSTNVKAAASKTNTIVRGQSQAYSPIAPHGARRRRFDQSTGYCTFLELGQRAGESL